MLEGGKVPCWHARQRYAFLRARVLPCRMPQRRRAGSCSRAASPAVPGPCRAHAPGCARNAHSTARAGGPNEPINAYRTSPGDPNRAARGTASASTRGAICRAVANAALGASRASADSAFGSAGAGV
jgi:hypothetical protein